MQLMRKNTEHQLLSKFELPAARVLNANGSANAVLVCEHASRFIPAALDGLGLEESAAESHAAWDIGAMDLSVELAGALDASLVHSRVSRLVYDCNRPPERADATPGKSEIFTIPGNTDLSETQRARRVREVYEPFRNLLSQTLDSFSTPPVMITVHSFTSVYNGKPRNVELGILHDDDDRAAKILMRLAKDSGLKTALNEPYSASDGVTHTLKEHAIPRGLHNVMLEIRNDLISSAAGVNRISGLLAPMLQQMIKEIASAGR